jgi:energy-coupling factor transport system substrate-specific component
MREVWRMWNYSTMVVLTVLTAGLFAAILIPFKGIPLIPGVTELRPANVIPVVLGLLFGPAGAWGAALGNLLGDFFGTLGIASFFGFWGNFVAAYLTYKIWGNVSLERFSQHWWRFFGCVLLGSVACAQVIGYGLEVLHLLPFSVIAVAILANNFITPCILGPLLLRLLYPRVSRWDLQWQELMDPADQSSGPFPRLGKCLVWLGGIGGYLVGLGTSLGLAASWGVNISVAEGVTPFMVMLIVGCFFL